MTYAFYPPSGGGGGGIQSINTDTSSAQVIAGGTGISVATTSGTTTITNTSPSSGGTVTSVSVTTANGVSGTVATATTTPAISLTLGAITPTSVAASGALSGSNFSGSSSGTNTGDQTITLTGPVTGSGTGSFATSVTGNAITNTMLAQMATHTIKGNNGAGTANAADLTAAQVNAILPVFTSSLNGLAPLSGGGSTNYLRADGTWAVPPGATSGTVTSVAVSGGTTGLTTSGGPVTTSGTITIAGTLAVANGGTGSTTGLVTQSGIGMVASAGQLLGTNTNNNATAGNVGEYVSSTVAGGSAVSLTTGVAANVTSISLTAGDWDISGIIMYTGSASAFTNYNISISPTSATQGTLGDTRINVAFTGTTAASDTGLSIPLVRVSLASTTTYYLVASAGYGAGTLSAYGRISARRRR